MIDERGNRERVMRVLARHLAWRQQQHNHQHRLHTHSETRRYTVIRTTSWLWQAIGNTNWRSLRSNRTPFTSLTMDMTWKHCKERKRCYQSSHRHSQAQENPTHILVETVPPVAFAVNSLVLMRLSRMVGHGPRWTGGVADVGKDAEKLTELSMV